MKLVTSVALFLTLTAAVGAQTNWSDLTRDSAEQGTNGLKIIKARAQQEAIQGAGVTRAFMIEVQNTSERAIESIEFTFVVTDENVERDANGNPLSCGFTISNLNVKPGDSTTIERQLSGIHCIPPGDAKQAVRIQKIVYSDGSTWRRIGEDSDWKRVKTPKAGTPDPNQ